MRQKVPHTTFRFTPFCRHLPACGPTVQWSDNVFPYIWLPLGLLSHTRSRCQFSYWSDFDSSVATLYTIQFTGLLRRARHSHFCITQRCNVADLVRPCICYRCYQAMKMATLSIFVTYHFIVQNNIMRYITFIRIRIISSYKDNFCLGVRFF